MHAEETFLVIGSGAREDALRWSIEQNHPERRVLGAPGNDGFLPTHRRAAKDSDAVGILRLAREENARLVVIGPEQPLVDGLADFLRNNDVPAFGPSAYAAELEGSKIFTKTRCKRWGIPTADFDFAGSYPVAERIINKKGFCIIKADGLCAGKGVTVAASVKEALEAAHQLLVEKVHGTAGARIVMEERLIGQECSVMAFCDGINAVLAPVARDFKRALDGDKGPNTGGMGSYSPLSDVTDDLLTRIKETIIMPTLRGMAAEGRPYHGLLYAGIMLTAVGPYLLEYNVRFGDPETQVVLARIESDIVEYMVACNTLGGLAELGTLKVRSDAAVCVVLASQGYPGKYATGFPIRGIENVPADALIFHAGTNRIPELVTSGGRVMSVVGLGANVEKARQRSNEVAHMIEFENKYRRTDIALNA